MKQVYVLTALFYSFLAVSACSQSKSLIKRTEAFYAVRLPGILPVDENGGQAPADSDTTNFIYVETGQQNISWGEAFIQGKSFVIVAEKLQQKEIEIGQDKATHGLIRLKSADSNYLWRLTFRAKQLSDSILTNQLIVLKGKVDNKAFSIPLNSRREIILPDVNQ